MYETMRVYKVFSAFQCVHNTHINKQRILETTSDIHKAVQKL